MGGMNRETHIACYFPLEADLASEMRDWPEFVSGQADSLDLKSRDSDETVTVRYVKRDYHLWTVSGNGTGTLFDLVLGRVIYALSNCNPSTRAKALTIMSAFELTPEKNSQN